MCAGYGYCCCCKCQYKFSGVQPFELTHKLWAGSILEDWSNVIDEGSPIRCSNRVVVDSPVRPALEFGAMTEWGDYYIPDPGSWYTYSLSGIFPTGWTYTPDGAAHNARYSADWMLREYWLLWNTWVNPSNNRDIDVDRDPDTIEAHDYENFFLIVRQAGQYYVNLCPIGPTTGRHIYGDGQDYLYGSPGSSLKTATWRRRIQTDGQRLPFLWTSASGGLGTTWLSLLNQEDAVDFPYEYPFGGILLDNAIGAPDWEIGFGVFGGISQQPATFGQTTKEGSESGYRFWLDNICLNID